MKKEVTRKKCLNCGHKFTYREKLRAGLSLFGRLQCSQCGTRYRQSFIFITLFLLALTGPKIVIDIFNYIYHPSNDWNTISLPFYLGYAVLLAVLYPILSFLKSDPIEEESMDEEVE